MISIITIMIKSMLAHFGPFPRHLDAGEIVVVATVEAATTIDT